MRALHSAAEGMKGRTAYSCADICWSESRHALIFKRRHTQHKFSAGLGPAAGVHTAPHTAQCFVADGFSVCTHCFAISIISGETTGSVAGFFFIPVLTIKQIARPSDNHVTKRRLCRLRLLLSGRPVSV